ncbi:hypothetical protein SDC9_166218 [bioreactor metagenome]|uniref:Uncharacterized protein n=1 Tax=bioreactor metagenome TaxID=1076179 RepID=A0A645G4A0_9ZZZZ
MTHNVLERAEPTLYSAFVGKICLKDRVPKKRLFGLDTKERPCAGRAEREAAFTGNRRDGGRSVVRANRRKWNPRNAEFRRDLRQQRTSERARAVDLRENPRGNVEFFNQLEIPILRARAVKIRRGDVGIFALLLAREQISQ